MANEKYYEISFIRELAVKSLAKRKVTLEDAQVIVDSMIEADCCGVGTHGIRMLVPYIQKLEKEEFSLDKPEIIKSTPALTVLDAKNSIGAVSANIAVNIVMKEAKRSGLHMVFSKNSNTYGPAFYYAEKIAKQGMIGFTCCNSPAAMPAINGAEPILGTNPLAFACPSASQGTMILDMATSIVAKSKIALANAKGQKLPDGWALDADGNPTNDPMEAIKGLVLPMAGPKGCGLAMAIDIAAGFLSGAGYLNKVGKFYSQTGNSMNVGQLFVAIDPAAVYDGDFMEDMDEYMTIVRSSKAVRGRKVTIPGDRKLAARARAYIDGILLSDDIVKALEN